MEVTSGTTIRDIVGNNHRAAAVFERYSIDFCCGGNKTLEAACAQKGIDPELIQQELRQAEPAGETDSLRPGEWDLDTLADFIVNTHHRYVRRALPTLLAHLNKVVSVHGAGHPELSGILDRFQQVADELTRHMQKEEIVLFPYIRSLVAASRTGETVPRPIFPTIRFPIQMMEAEHSSAGDAFSFIRTATGDFAPPPDACETYRVTYRQLEEFEHDLHRHIHLENNILFPRAITLEERVFSHDGEPLSVSRR